MSTVVWKWLFFFCLRPFLQYNDADFCLVCLFLLVARKSEMIWMVDWNDILFLNLFLLQSVFTSFEGVSPFEKCSTLLLSSLHSVWLILSWFFFCILEFYFWSFFSWSLALSSKHSQMLCQYYVFSIILWILSITLANIVKSSAGRSQADFQFGKK